MTLVPAPHAPATTPRSGAVPGGEADRHPVRGVLFGMAVAALTYAAMASGALSGVVALGMGIALVALTPTSPLLGRRVAINGSLVLGWVEVLWWVRWPLHVDHAAVVVAMGCGALVGHLVSGSKPATSLRRLLPRPCGADALIVVGAGVSLLAMSRWALASTPVTALTAMLPGYDGVAHFSMFASIRTAGAITPSGGPAPDGSTWLFNSYPQGFHALAATLSELTRPRLGVGPDLVLAYAHAVVMVIVLGVVVLTAALVSLPGLRDRLLLSLPAVVVMWMAFLWKPGQNLLADGFGNFWLAAACAGAALLLSLAPARRLSMPDVLAVGGLLVLMANSWFPMVVLGGPAVLGLFHPLAATFRDPGLRSRRRWAVGLLVVAACGAAKALVTLSTTVGVGALVQATGGIHGTSPLPIFVLVILVFYVCLAGPSLARRTGAGPDTLAVVKRGRLLVLAPVGACAIATLLLVLQLRTIGTSAYYFVKFVMGIELTLAALVPALIAVLVAERTLGSHVRRALAVGTSLICALLASQSFGLFPHGHIPLSDPHHDGTASVGPPLSAPRMAAGIVSAAGAAGAATDPDRDYLALGPARAGDAFYPDGWYHCLEGGLTTRRGARFETLRTRVVDVDQAVPLVIRLLHDRPRGTVVVDPRYVAPLRQGVGAPLAAQVVGW